MYFGISCILRLPYAPAIPSSCFRSIFHSDCHSTMLSSAQPLSFPLDTHFPLIFQFSAHCSSQALSSAHLCSVPLYCAPLCSIPAPQQAPALLSTHKRSQVSTIILELGPSDSS